MPVRRILRHFGFLATIGRSEIGLLVTLAALAGGIWLFVAIADEVSEGEMQRFDRGILLAMRNPARHEQPIGPHYVQEAARDFTALGGVTVLTLLTLVVGIFLILSRRARMALFVWAAVLSGAALSTGLKAIFNRPRPELVPHAVYVYASSFPSGHSMLSAITYLTLGTLVARSQRRRSIKIFVIAVALFVTIGVGLTRIYLGVHWPSDVLAGWTAGAVWALLWWTAADWLQRRRTLREGPES